VKNIPLKMNHFALNKSLTICQQNIIKKKNIIIIIIIIIGDAPFYLQLIYLTRVEFWKNNKDKIILLYIGKL
jgi:hypothetical protein